MCVIIAKTNRCRPPSINTFERAMTTNPHGFALAWKIAGQPWRTFKTMDKARMLDFIASCGALRKKSLFVFHARIKTHGPTSVANCHCWKDLATDTIFAHNGVLPIEADKNKTDSETFFRHVFAPICRHEGKSAALKACRVMCGKTSRMAVVFEKEKKNQVALVGKWIRKNRIAYSNSSAFEPERPKPVRYWSPWGDLLDEEEDELATISNNETNITNTLAQRRAAKWNSMSSHQHAPNPAQATYGAHAPATTKSPSQATPTSTEKFKPASADSQTSTFGKKTEASAA